MIAGSRARAQVNFKVVSMSGELRSVFIYGRFKDVSRREIERLVAERGERLARSGLRADTVVVAHSALDRCIVGSAVRLPFEMAPSAALLSENTFRRALMPSDAETSPGPYSIFDVAPPFPNVRGDLPCSRTFRRHREICRDLYVSGHCDSQASRPTPA